MSDTAAEAKFHCVASVPLRDGNDLSLLRHNGDTITTNWHPSIGRLVRGKSYRVTFEEIECPVQP